MWKTGIPEDGKYLVTVKTSLMVDYRTGSHSYAYETDVAEYCNGWSIDGVIAWKKLPAPYCPEIDLRKEFLRGYIE